MVTSRPNLCCAQMVYAQRRRYNGLSNQFQDGALV